MKQLLTIKEKDIFPNVVENPNIQYKKREAARAVVFDKESKIAIMNVSKHHYHKLPGGGLQGGEDVHQALARELKEEIGCKAEIVKKVGQIIEYRDFLNEYSFNSQIQYSYCFIANLVGKKGKPSFEDDEIENGFKIMWVPMDTAIKLLSTDKTNDYQGNFILKRDLAFLEEAKKLVQNT